MLKMWRVSAVVLFKRDRRELTRCADAAEQTSPENPNRDLD